MTGPEHEPNGHADDLSVKRRDESHKSHKSSKHKKHKHKSHKDRDRHRARDSSEERERPKKSDKPKDAQEVGSDPESGEIPTGNPTEGLADQPHVDSSSKQVTDTRSSGRVRAEGDIAEGSPSRHVSARASNGETATANPLTDEPVEQDSAGKASRKRDRSPDLPLPPPLPRPEEDLDGDKDRHKRSRTHGDGGDDRDAGHDRGRDRQQDRARSRERSRERERRQQQQERSQDRERDRERDRGRPAEGDRRRDNDRERDRDRRSRHEDVARVSDRAAGHREGSRQPEDRRREDSDRRRDRRDDRSDRRDERSDRRDRDRDRERDRERDRDRDRDRERERDRDREKERDRREDRREDNSRRGAAPQEEEEEEGDDLLLLDPEELENRRIEEARRRRAELLAKKQQEAALNEAVINPTATALAQAGPSATQPAAPASSAGPSSAAPSPMPHAASRLGQSPAVGAAAASPAVKGGAGSDDEEDGAGAGAAAVPGDGERTPEGDRTSSSDSGNANEGPVMDIWGKEVLGDDAESRPALADMEGGAEAADRSRPGSVTVAERVTALEATHKDEEGEEEDDMFALDSPERERQEQAGAPGAAAGGAAQRQRGAAGAQADTYDDAEGYYNFQIGELLEGRYEVLSSNGRGVFGVVVMAKDKRRQDEKGNHPEVAVKLIRANETMHKAAQLELRILKLLGDADPENKKHCIRLLSSFEYRNHMCLVFEPMEMNLRDLIRKVGRNQGLHIEAVQLFTCQLLMALRHLKKHQVLHADIKPDNILINHRRNKVKLCDFGSAMLAGENEVTPYLVSRYYRAPEVILGLPYDYAMDMWAIGSVVYELVTGKILFPGHTNNEMLKLMMDVKGGFPKKMLKRGAFSSKHFNLDDLTCPFVSVEKDPITGNQVRRDIHTIVARSTFSTRLAKMRGDRTKINYLIDLLDKMMALEPERRIDPDTALRHPFVKEFLPKKEPGHKRRQKAA